MYRFANPITGMALSRSNPDKIVVSTWGRIYYSLDAGATFNEYYIPDEMTYSINYKIAVHPTNENEIWVGDGNPGGMWRTIDNGATWEKMDDGLTFAGWNGNVEPHSIGRFFLTGNEKNAVYAIAFTMGYLNESYTTPRGRVLYRDDTTDGWQNLSDGLPMVANLNRMLPFYKEGVIRLATNNGIWQRPLVDSEFKPIAQPLILNAGSGDNTTGNYPREVRLESYSIVNQANVQWKWKINPAPLSITSFEVRNPVITIEPNQTYDISLTVTTPAGSDTKCIKGMIKGGKPVPDATLVENISNVKDIILLNGNVVTVGENFIFAPTDLSGETTLHIYNSKGEVVEKIVSTGKIEINTAGYAPGVYFFMAADEVGFKKTGKLLVRE